MHESTEELTKITHIEKMSISNSATASSLGNPLNSCPFMYVPALGHASGLFKEALLLSYCENLVHTFDSAIMSVRNLEECRDTKLFTNTGFNPWILLAGKDGFYFAYHYFSKQLKVWSNELVKLRNNFDNINPSFQSETKKVEAGYEEIIFLLYDVTKFMHSIHSEYKSSKTYCFRKASTYNINCDRCHQEDEKMKKFMMRHGGFQTTMFHQNEEPEMKVFFQKVSYHLDPILTTESRNIVNQAKKLGAGL